MLVVGIRICRRKWSVVIRGFGRTFLHKILAETFGERKPLRACTFNDLIQAASNSRFISNVCTILWLADVLTLLCRSLAFPNMQAKHQMSLEPRAFWVSVGLMNTPILPSTGARGNPASPPVKRSTRKWFTMASFVHQSAHRHAKYMVYVTSYAWESLYALEKKCSESEGRDPTARCNFGMGKPQLYCMFKCAACTLRKTPEALLASRTLTVGSQQCWHAKTPFQPTHSLKSTWSFHCIDFKHHLFHLIVQLQAQTKVQKLFIAFTISESLYPSESLTLKSYFFHTEFWPFESQIIFLNLARLSLHACQGLLFWSRHLGHLLMPRVCTLELHWGWKDLKRPSWWLRILSK